MSGVILCRFPTGHGDQQVTGAVAELGVGHVGILTGTWAKYWTLIILPAINPRDPRSPGIKEGEAGFASEMSNIEPEGPGIMLVFRNLLAVENLRKSLDSVERQIREAGGA